MVTLPPSGSSPAVLLERFSRVFGLDPSTLTPERERLNVTLGAAQTELLRRVNVALGDRLPVVRAGYSRVAKVHLADQVLAAQEGARLRLPDRLSPWCHERAEQIVRRLEAAGYDVVGDLDELLPGAAARGADDEAIEERAVTAAAVDALAAMLDQRHHDLRRLDRLRASVNRAGQPRRVRVTAGARRVLDGVRSRMQARQAR